MNDNHNQKIDDDYVLRWSREEERHEIAWIGHRLGWLLVSQSFLIATAVLSQSDDFSWWYGIVISIVLGKLGIWLSFRGLIAIKAAQIIIDEGWLKKAGSIYSANKYIRKNLTIPRKLHVSNNCQQVVIDDDFHKEAIKLHLNVGWAFIFVWIIIMMLSVVSALSRSGHVSIRPSYESKVILWAIFIASIFVISMLMFYRFTRSYNKIDTAEAEMKKLNSNITQCVNNIVPGTQSE